MSPAQPKLAQRVAEAIEREILARERPAGERLGTETELMARYGVGRSVLREALILIARDGLAEMRRGKIGGLVVRAPSEPLIVANLQTYLDLVVEDFDEIWRIRRELEAFALTLAIDRFEAGDLSEFERLEACFQAAQDQNARLALGGAALQAIAGASRNPFLSLLVNAFSSLGKHRLARSGAQPGSLLARAEEVAVLRREQLRAVMAAAPARALVASEQIFGLFEAMARLPAARGASQAEPFADEADSAEGSGKLADKVAQAIKDEIVSQGLSEGARVGSEPELMARYGVSRGAVREAIRILERLSVAGAARGKGGGLRVLAPTPHSVVRSTCVYLRARGVRQRSLQEVGEVVGRLAAEMAARNVGMLDAGNIRVRAEEIESLEAGSLRELAFAHFNMLGELSGSRAIGLVESILANLYSLDESTAATQVPERLRDLLDAILQGKPDLARRRMMLLQRAGATATALPLSQLQDPELLDVISRRAPKR